MAPHKQNNMFFFVLFFLVSLSFFQKRVFDHTMLPLAEILSVSETQEFCYSTVDLHQSLKLNMIHKNLKLNTSTQCLCVIFRKKTNTTLINTFTFTF